MDSYSGVECQLLSKIRGQIWRQTLPAPGTTSHSGGPRGLLGWPRIGSPPMGQVITGSNHFNIDSGPAFLTPREVMWIAIPQMVSGLPAVISIPPSSPVSSIHSHISCCPPSS